jgi:hypothetical protein
MHLILAGRPRNRGSILGKGVVFSVHHVSTPPNKYWMLRTKVSGKANRGRWQTAAVRRDAADLLQIRNWKAAARLEESDRGSNGPKTGRNAIEEDEESIPALGPTQPPIQWLQLYGREANHSSPSSVEVQTASTLPGGFRMWCSRTGTTLTFKLKTRERF